MTTELLNQLISFLYIHPYLFFDLVVMQPGIFFVRKIFTKQKKYDIVNGR